MQPGAPVPGTTREDTVVYSSSPIGKAARSQASSTAASRDVQELLTSSTSPMPSPSGSASESSRTAPAHHEPYVAASQAVPGIALAPLLVLWIGYGTLPVVILCAFMVFFPITITVLLGLRGLDTDIIDAARLDGAHGLSMLVHMELPMTLPAIYTGLRTGFTLSITGAVVGEMIMGGEGLGMLLSTQRDKVDTTGMFSTIALLCILATTIHWALHELEQRSRTVDALRGRRAG